MTDFVPSAPEIIDAIQHAEAGKLRNDYRKRSVTYEDVEKLLIALKPRELANHAFLFCDNFFTVHNAGSARVSFDALPGDLREMQRIMLDALDALGKARDGASAASDGGTVSLVSISDKDVGKLAAAARDAVSKAHDETPGFVKRLAGDYAALVCPIVSIVIDDALAPEYGSFLRRSTTVVPGWNVEEYPATGALLVQLEPAAESLFPDTADGRTDALKYAADALFTLHMSDIRTVSSDGGKESRISATGASMAWWLLLDHLRNGRIGVCEECGKPFVSNNERGNPRRFCSKRCQMRANRRRKAQTPPNGGLDSKGDISTTGKEVRP